MTKVVRGSRRHCRYWRSEKCTVTLRGDEEPLKTKGRTLRGGNDTERREQYVRGGPKLRVGDGTEEVLWKEPLGLYKRRRRKG